MPKDVSERIIDSPFALTTRSGSVSIGGGGGGGGGATNLDALTDVTLSAPSNGQTLAYNSGSGQWVNSAPAAMVAHALSGAFHTGLLNWSLINFTPSDMADIATRRHIDLQGIGPNDHHNQAHVLATGTALGADHTISGAAAGEVLRALTATTAAFDVLQHTDLGNVLPDQHHTRAHDIITGDASGAVHTITGSQFQVVGATATNVLGLLTPTPTPGAAAAILRTDSNGGIQLDTNLFYVDGANNRIGINRTPGATLDVIAFANADHTQRLKQKSGQTGRLWRIEDTAGNELIVLDSVGNLQSGSPGFVSGLTGWQITPQGNAEFNNIWARGELHATVFVKDEIHATGGTLLVATAGTLHDDAVISSATVDDDVLVVYSTPAGMGVPLQVVTTSGAFTGTELHVSWIGNFITINDPPSGPGFYFQPGDIVRSKTEVPTGVTDFWLEVNSAVQNSGYATYSVVKRSGTDGTLPKGSAVVSYGREGDGRILLTSDLNYAPYIDVFTVGPNVWTGAAGAIVPRMRMGRLDGIGLPGVSGVTQYGMIAGKDLSDANSGYLIASNLQFSLYKVDIRLNDGTSDTGLWTANGNLKIGKNIGAAATTGLQFDTVTGDLIIGNPAGTPTPHFLRWNQSTGKLTVQGDLLVSDPATSVSLETMTNADNAVRADAQGYATTAQSNATAYGDARRIVGVTGSWDSPTLNTIRWGTKAVAATPASVALAAAFGNNTTRTIADHAAASVSVTSRTYMFVSVAGTGTMTMTATTSLTTVMASVNNVLIAVCDPGDSLTKACSITVVAGSTYMSGSNIFTGSIVAAQIAAGTITTANLAAATITSLNAYADGTQTAAQGYGDNRRVVAVTGTWTVVDGDTITWASLQVKFANLTAKTITAELGHAFTPAGRHYLYVDVTDSAPMPMFDTTSLGSLGANHALIAVVDTGTLKASIAIVAGSTYISGGNIMASSIVSANIAASTITAGNIAASTITADRMNVQRLDAMKGTFGTLLTGVIEVDTLSNIHSAGKTAYADATAGFFLGYSSSLYRFDVGDANNYLRWTGTRLELKSEWVLEIGTDASSNALYITNTVSGRLGLIAYDNAGNHAFVFTDPIYAPHFLAATGTVQAQQLRAVTTATSGSSLYFGASSGNDSFTYDHSGALSVLNYTGALTVAGSFTAGGALLTASNNIRIATAFTPSSNSSPAGTAGDIRWDANFIYVWSAGQWRRAVLNTF